MLDFEQVLLLCTKQKKLDDYIIANNCSEDVITKNKFALKIELYEFINELGMHKHWKKSPFKREAAQEELVDMLHFALFLLYKNELSISQDEIRKYYKNFNEYELTFESVVALETKFLKLWESNSYVEFVCLIDHINTLFFESDIFFYYDEKYKKNIKRQEENY